MPVLFGPGGNSDSFAKRKFPDDLPQYLGGLKLQCYEIECGRGVRISQATYDRLPKIAQENNLTITLHAPYFISLSSTEREKRDNSIRYIADSLAAARLLGARIIVVHTGSTAKMARRDALLLAADTVSRALETLPSSESERRIAR